MDEIVKEEVAVQPTVEQAPVADKKFNNRGNGGGYNNNNNSANGGRPRFPRRDNKRDNKEDDGLITKLVSINRVTKVVKGGRTMRFAALVVAGDGKGKVGLGLGKAAEVPQAIEKATAQAKRNMITVAMVGTTIPHQILGQFSRGSVLLMPAPEGTGVIAGGSVRNVLEVCGIKDVRAKSHGSSNPINNVRATIEGLRQLRTIEEVAARRNKTVEEIQA